MKTPRIPELEPLPHDERHRVLAVARSTLQLRGLLAVFPCVLALAASAHGAPSAELCAREGEAKCAAYDAAKSNWTAFHGELLANQGQKALSLVHPGCVKEIKDALLSPDADLVAFAKSVVEFEVVESPLSFDGSNPKAKGYISAALILDTEEGKQMFLLTFFQDKDNAWKLCNM